MITATISLKRIIIFINIKSCLTFLPAPDIPDLESTIISLIEIIFFLIRGKIGIKIDVG